MSGGKVGLHPGVTKVQDRDITPWQPSSLMIECLLSSFVQLLATCILICARRLLDCSRCGCQAPHHDAGGGGTAAAASRCGGTQGRSAPAARRAMTAAPGESTPAALPPTQLLCSQTNAQAGRSFQPTWQRLPPQQQRAPAALLCCVARRSRAQAAAQPRRAASARRRCRAAQGRACASGRTPHHRPRTPRQSGAGRHLSPPPRPRQPREALSSQAPSTHPLARPAWP